MLSQVILSSYLISGSHYSHTILPGQPKIYYLEVFANYFPHIPDRPLNISNIPQILLHPRLKETTQRVTTLAWDLPKRFSLLRIKGLFDNCLWKRNIITSFPNYSGLWRIWSEVMAEPNITNWVYYRRLFRSTTILQEH